MSKTAWTRTEIEEDRLGNEGNMKCLKMHLGFFNVKKTHSGFLGFLNVKKPKISVVRPVSGSVP